MKRLSMRKIRDALRLRADGLSMREIGASLGVGRSTASEYLRRADTAGLVWPLGDDVSDTVLEQRLYPDVPGHARGNQAVPDWPGMHREMRRKNVTLLLLWEEYKAARPTDGYGYSRFCELYRRWEGRLSPTMLQHHIAGEKLFVDYSGDTFEVMDPQTGELRSAELFVAVLGASNYTYAEATWTHSLPDWISSHTRALTFFGGVTGMIVSDNLKSGITKACFYEPKVNRTYSDMAWHYGTAIVPARPYKPRDKAKVEVGVQVAQRWVMARLRNRRFFTLAELNAAIRELLDRLNAKTTRHLGASRRQLFEDLDRQALKPLPTAPYEYAEWQERKVGIDYHVEIDKHYYSVPYQLLRQTVWARITANTVEIFHTSQRVASHVRNSANRQHTSVREHMPDSHRRYADWTPEKIRQQAERIGPNAATLVDVILRERTHPKQGFRSCLGILRLAKPHGPDALEAACLRALEINARSYKSVNSILKNNLHRKRPEPATDGPAIPHQNIRGSGYFH